MKDLTGQRFGRLLVAAKSGANKWRNTTWLCVCDCGNTRIVPGGKLIQGKSRSCGCLARESSVKSLEKHGITTGGKPRTFTIWRGMKARCLNKNSVSYKSYGARGIGVCSDWMTFENFHNWAISNGYEDGLTIDRINNDGNYEPDNCRWVSKEENKKKQRKARYFTVCGITKNVSDWCKYLKVSKSEVYKHINSGKGQQYFINRFLDGGGVESKAAA